MKKYDVLIFDLDDTLFDFQATEKEALTQIFKHYQIEPTQKNIDQYKTINHALWRALEAGDVTRDEVLNTRFTRFLKAHNQDVDGALVEAKYRQLLNQGHHLLPHAKELMMTLKEQGYQLFAGTNGLSATQKRRLTDAQLLEFFEDIFISEELGIEKPHVNFFNAIFNKYNLTDKTKILMIGDSLTADIQGAHNSGIDSVWMNHHQKTVKHPLHTYEIQNLKELLNILES